jgi:cytochrome c553
MLRSRLALIGLLLMASQVVPAAADPIEDKAAVCASCHGENGIPVDPKYPAIWGQKEGYLYVELRDFNKGNRKNELMSPIAQGLSKDDMKELAAYFAAKPWPNLSQAKAPDDVASHAQTIAGSAQCSQCHLGGFLGDSTNPRLAGQNHDYLLKTMNEFRSGERNNNSWMTSLLKTYTDSDIQALATYIAGL